MKKNKIVVTGGGTGGHVLPLISVIEELKKENLDILYIGSGNKIERQEAEKIKIKYKAIFTGKYRRYFDFRNFIDIFKIIFGFLQSFFIILFYNPEKVFSKGGYVGLPVIYAAWILRKKIFIHETDAKLGLANKLSLNKCNKIFVSFSPKYYPEIPVEKVIYTGSPLKKEYKNVKKEKFFKNNNKIILVTGGSQGARFLNQTIAKIIPKLTRKYNVIHLCGEMDYEWLRKNNWDNYILYSFSNKFPQFLYNSDLVISRSGGTIFEIAYCKKPAILISLPGSANEHQKINAQVLEEKNAAIVLNQKNLSSESLYEIISRLLEDKNLLNELSLKIGEFYQEDASKTIAQNILQ